MDNNRKISFTEKTNVWTVVYLILFSVSAVFVIWKCRYGFGNIDESFYLTIPYRLYQGDSLFANEWHLSQMSGLLLWPLVSLYMFIFKSTTGILLAFRYLYICILGLTSLVVFFRLKKFNPAGAAVAALVFFLYAPFNISALSYNTMGIIFMTLCTVFFVSETGGKKRITDFLISGFFLAAAVLCCPYLVIVYAAYTICVFVYAVFFKSINKGSIDALSVKTWFVFSAGIAILVAMFAVFVLSRASLNSIINSFKPILNDPEHQERGIIFKLINYIKSILLNNSFFSFVAYILILILTIVTLIDKNKEKRQSFYMICSAALCGYLFCVFMYFSPYINFLMFPINLFAIECLILFWKNVNIRNLFFKIWMPGMIYSFCIHMSSIQAFYAISSASVVSLCASFVIAFIAVKENLNDNQEIMKRVAALSICCLTVMQICFEVYLRYESVFWEYGISNQVYEIEDGYEKGVITTQEKKDLYYDFIDIKDYVIHKYGENRAILFLSKNTWYYLVFDNYTNSSYSSWLSGVNDASLKKLEEYYKINPEKVPELIYVESEYTYYIKSFKKSYSFKEENLKNGAVILSEFSAK